MQTRPHSNETIETATTKISICTTSITNKAKLPQPNENKENSSIIVIIRL